MKPVVSSIVVCLFLVLLRPAFAQSASSGAEDYSGMYSFVREGEFVQITIEPKGQVSGFVSRFSDSESDKGTFLDQFFKQGNIEGNKLTFTTDSVQGIWYKFDGLFDRGEGKKPEEEGYYVMRGTLTRFNQGADHKTTAQDSKVEFRSFPRDAMPPK